MTELVWDKVGERFYQTGIDRGVLYLRDGTAVPWNGLVSVEDAANSEVKSIYLDGIKISENVTPGEFSGKLTAFTYPDEFDVVVGVAESMPGLFYHEQPSKSFHLSYRTKIGNDVVGDDYGYKIHLLYNLVAAPDSHVFETQKIPVNDLSTFSWALSGVPPMISGRRPTVHISIDSTKASSRIMEGIESILYGTSVLSPRIPSIDELEALFRELDALIITDMGAGSWTGSDLSSSYITMLDSTTFKIDEANVELLDPYTYKISTTYFHNLGQDYLENLKFKAPDGGIWDVVVTTDGTFDIEPGVVGEIPPLDHVNMIAPDTGVWAIAIANDGVLTIDSGTTSLIDLDQIQMNSIDSHVWVVTVTDDGYIDIS